MKSMLYGKYYVSSSVYCISQYVSYMRKIKDANRARHPVRTGCCFLKKKNDKKKKKHKPPEPVVVGSKPTGPALTYRA